jgi:hypothetical protein
MVTPTLTWTQRTVAVFSPVQPLTATPEAVTAWIVHPAGADKVTKAAGFGTVTVTVTVTVVGGGLGAAGVVAAGAPPPVGPVAAGAPPPAGPVAAGAPPPAG